MNTRTALYEQQALRNWSALRDAWEIHAELFERTSADFPEPPDEVATFSYSLTAKFEGRSVIVAGQVFDSPGDFPVQINAEVVATDDGKPGEFLFAIEEWDFLDDFPVQNETTPCAECDSTGCEVCWEPCGDCKGYLNEWGECSWCATGGNPDTYNEPWALREFEVCDAIRTRLAVEHEVVGDTMPG
jgi:hypothetical protein